MIATQAVKNTDHFHLLDKAKVKLMGSPDSAFFTHLCFSLKQRFDDTVPTAYTDGREIVWGTKFFVEMLDDQERIFLMLHETLHCAYLHMVRMPAGWCPDRWNIACDHVINLQLIARGFKMPVRVPGHADPRFIGVSAEEVYLLLPDNPGKPAMSDLMPGDGDTAASKQLEADMQDILIRAQMQSKMSGDKPGTIPGDIQIYLNGLLTPKLPWNRILQKYLNQVCKSDYSFRIPNRRFFPKYHLPSLWGEKLMNLTVAVDVSGSVSDHDFHIFVSEVASILRMMKPEKITLIQFDGDIRSVDEIKSIQDLMRCKFTGRGGTLINPVLEWVNTNKPRLLLVFSDGEFNFYGTETKTETVWVIHNDHKKSFAPPFGKTIHYETTP